MLVFFLLVTLALFDSVAQNKQPNILFIIADDISRNSYGAYGCEYIKTSGFDKLAKEGVLFTNAITNNPTSFQDYKGQILH